MHLELVEIINNGGIAVIPTDTIYGLVANAFDVDAVERIYELKDRDRSKALIVLIDDASKLRRFNISPVIAERARQQWEASDKPLSIVLPQPDRKWRYIARNTQHIAFRVPASDAVRQLLVATGPLVAPSANPEGLAPARTVNEAEDYFGGTVDYYLDGGLLKTEPSRIVRFSADGTVVIRE